MLRIQQVSIHLSDIWPQATYIAGLLDSKRVSSPVCKDFFQIRVKNRTIFFNQREKMKVKKYIWAVPWRTITVNKCRIS
jgi:hypothetical protein